MKMKKMEMDNFIRKSIIETLNLTERNDVSKIGNSTYAMEVETPEGTFYGKIQITACQRTDTKVNPAFNLETAIEKYENEVRESQEKAERKAQEKAEKERMRAEAKAAKEAEKANKADK